MKTETDTKIWRQGLFSELHELYYAAAFCVNCFETELFSVIIIIFLNILNILNI